MFTGTNYFYRNITNDSRTIHEVIVASGLAANAPGLGPTSIVLGDTTLGLQFTLDTVGDRAYRTFKIPSTFIDDPSNPPKFHVHWSKSGSTNESGKYVRWHIGYKIFNGTSDNVSGSITDARVEDTYDDTGTTSKIVYRATDVPLTGFVAGYYCSAFIDAETPVGGTAMASEPVLVSLDLTYRAYINQGTYP